MSWFRTIRKLAGSSSLKADFVFERHHRAFGVSTIIVHAFYLMNLSGVSSAVSKWIDLRSRIEIQPLWPVAWIASLGVSFSVDLILSLLIIGSISAALVPQFRTARFMAAAGLFFFVALENSFGKIDHGDFACVYLSLVLIFLPKTCADQEMSSRRVKQIYLSVILLCQAIFLFIYSLSGFWKLRTILDAIFRGNQHLLSREGFSYLLAQQLVITPGNPSILGPLLADHSQLGRLLMSFGLYLELGAMAVLFRPSLHRIWGQLIILLHLGNVLILNAPFAKNIWVSGLLLVLSPFYLKDVSLWNRIEDLPIACSCVKFLKSFGKKQCHLHSPEVTP